MSLIEHYRNQFAWRDWHTAMAALPPLSGCRVLDLGCGIGDQAALLCDRGARVVGVDGNPSVIAAARARSLAGAEFVVGDLLALPPLAAPFDGIWASFTAAYFVDLGPVLAAWLRLLRPGGFLALIEIDDMFAHQPVGPRTRELLDRYVDEALAARRYDFRMGRKLADYLAAQGCTGITCRALADREFACVGAALPEVVQAWRDRFELMRLLRVQFGADYEAVRDDFLACLSSTRHVSQARVIACVAHKPAD